MAGGGISRGSRLADAKRCMLTVGLGGPAGEVLGVEGELGLELLDGVGVVEEEDLDGVCESVTIVSI